MYKIGELSQLCRLPVKTLRYWADIGLLVPDEVDRFTGYRYYDASRLADCSRIVALKELGFTLEEIRQHTSGDVPALIAAKKAALVRERERINVQLRRLEAMLAGLTGGESNMFEVMIRSEGCIRAAYVRRIFTDRAEAMSQMAEMRRRLPKSVQGSRGVIVNYETEYKERDFDLAVCVEICGEQELYAERVLSFAGDTASLVCGAGELDAAYRDMNRQLADMPAQIIGAVCEVYHNADCVELKAPVCLLTQPQEVPDDAIAPFEDDPDVIGMWEFVDLVPSAEQFLPGHPKYGDAENIPQKRLCFLPEGKGYWIVAGWTRGKLYTTSGYPKYRYAHDYTIEVRGGETYLFLARWDSYYRRRSGQPLIHVYRRLDSMAHTAEDMRIRDNVDLPFVPDDRILGKWRAVDCVQSIRDFVPGQPRWPDEPFWKQTEFFADGTAVAQLGDTAWQSDWTRGTMLDRRRMTAQAYTLREIDGREYLFIEWKSGDYLWAGRVNLYVFVRA
ncbi:MAG: MerR family transcriptional regulator [Clostridia bacterium]|nr:MerR family transcriptional regulator [Clostridia bacterium]